MCAIVGMYPLELKHRIELFIICILFPDSNVKLNVLSRKLKDRIGTSSRIDSVAMILWDTLSEDNTKGMLVLSKFCNIVWRIGYFGECAQ